MVVLFPAQYEPLSGHLVSGSMPISNQNSRISLRPGHLILPSTPHPYRLSSIPNCLLYPCQSWLSAVSVVTPAEFLQDLPCVSPSPPGRREAGLQLLVYHWGLATGSFSVLSLSTKHAVEMSSRPRPERTIGVGVAIWSATAWSLCSYRTRPSVPRNQAPMCSEPVASLRLGSLPNTLHSILVRQVPFRICGAMCF